ncbi:MAG: hypothetical protein ACUVX8_11585, partial [Candidatus Zipacnadales bacterium]
MRYALVVTAVLLVVLGATVLLTGCPKKEEPAPETVAPAATEPEAAVAPSTEEGATTTKEATTEEGAAAEEEATTEEGAATEEEATTEEGAAVEKEE